MPPFVPGLELSRRFYAEVVRPLLDRTHPDLPHTAARIGSGSEVLGFDTERSTDHEWGPRLQLFLRPVDARAHATAVDAVLRARLPTSFLGYPTHYEPLGATVGRMTPTRGPVNHRVEITDLGSWLTGRLGFDPRRRLDPLDWLATPSQRLVEATGGTVFHDGLAELEDVRRRLAWYPRDVWIYLLACSWQRIGQEEAFVGRCGEAGDELGSAVVAARLVRDLMRTCLLMARRYAPYSKWLGTAFAAVPGTGDLRAELTATLAATDWTTREEHLCRAYEAVTTRHNRLGLTDPVDPRTSYFHERPYRVLHAARLADALREQVADPLVRALPPIGSVDQFVDNTDVLYDPARARAAALAALGAGSGG